MALLELLVPEDEFEFVLFVLTFVDLVEDEFEFLVVPLFDTDVPDSLDDLLLLDVEFSDPLVYLLFSLEADVP